MIRILFSLRLETDFGVRTTPQPLLDCGPSISLACRGAASTRSWSTDYNIDLSFDWVGWACLSVSLRSPVGVVPAFLGVVVVFTMKTIISVLVPFLGSGLDTVWGCQEPFPPYLEENLGPRGVKKSVLAAMKWFALYIISRTVVGGFSTKDQNSLDGRIPIKKAWITKEGCVEDRSCLGGESVNKLSEGLLPSLGDAEKRGCRGLWSGIGQKVLLQFLHKLVEGNNGCWLETTVPHSSWSPQGGRENLTHECIGRVVQCHLSSEGCHMLGWIRASVI
ncbi:hypothetical protein BHE74_00024811 [Ensete ventricosum]|nr:hypothetical protein BHE74_00024811 [Ensete ventricosum]